MRKNTFTRRERWSIATALVAVLAFAPYAFAGFLPDPFAFSFFTEGLTTFFLLPFQLAGCG